MANNHLITNASIEEQKLRKHEIGEEYKLEPHSDCCIYRVPKVLRMVNEEAYTPQVISIGPLHHGKEELVDMEKQKIRYKREFSKRISLEKWQEFITLIEGNEQNIRNCYEEMPKFENQIDFIAMILYDAIFIIELFLRYHKFYCKKIDSYRRDFLISRTVVNGGIRADLRLLENQIPYFILDKLYQSAFGNHNPQPTSFYELSYFFFHKHIPNDLKKPEKGEVKHFVDLRRFTIINPHLKAVGLISDLPCALKLKDSGVKFKGIKTEELLNIKFEEVKSPVISIPWLKLVNVHKELQMPLLEVYDETEQLARNMMAFEQCHYPFETLVSDYFILLDHLIDTEEDVNLLVEARILSNHLGDNARTAGMFNKLCQSIPSNYSCFYGVAQNLKAHYNSPWNHVKATLTSVYFSNPWRGTATVAAVALLLLTFIQTICSILQVK